MIVDTSAVVAVLRGEEDAHRHLAAMEGADRLRMSAATLVELTIVVDTRRDPVLSRRLDELLDVLGVEVEPFDAEQAVLARRAYRDYGKGSGHAAGLNLGDCFTYALAAVSGEALLFKGDDFAATDLSAALDGRG
ncbi:type II toxin-antitoxin system VapC family toxin [uncultured Pseudokineococcus sp.]|uniref:type II toxin-antitoxin system VapC family toxin n=1 Tax=uncultured Pseudokineococcus sp. TaxID=1642928 RepID=UPI0026080C9C|nr:type II toxin-antitoxin system VapC family toxin [uncultured Pseudokineococcus sp.]